MIGEVIFIILGITFIIVMGYGVYSMSDSN